MYGAPFLVGQWNDGRTLQSRQHVDDFLQTSLGRIHPNVFLVLGILHGLETEQHLFQNVTLVLRHLLMTDEQCLALHHHFYLAQVVADEG